MAENIKAPVIEAEPFNPIDTGVADATRGIGRAVGDIIKGVDKLDKDVRSAEASRDSAAIVKKAQLEETAVEVTPFPETTNNAPLEELQALITKQRRAIEQGESNVAGLVASQIKTRIAQLIVKRPGIADRLHKEYNQFISFDPGFDALLNLDASRKDEGAIAQQDYDLTIDKAKELNINMALYRPGTPEFASIFLRRSAKDFEINEAEQLAEATLAVAARGMQEPAIQESFRKKLNGSKRIVSQSIRALQKLALQRAEFLRTGKGPAAAEAANFNALVKPDMLATIDIEIDDLRNILDDLSVDQRQSATAIALQAELDEEVDYLLGWRNAVDQDSLTLIDMMATQEAVKSAHLIDDNPRLDVLSSYARTFPELQGEDAQFTFGKENLAQRDFLGTQLGAGQAEFIAKTFVQGGAGVDLSDKSPVEIRNLMRGYLQMDNEPYGYPTDNNDWEAQAAAATDFLSEQFEQIQNMDPKTATPAGVMTRLLSVGTNIEAVATHAQQYQNT